MFVACDVSEIRYLALLHEKKDTSKTRVPTRDDSSGHVHLFKSYSVQACQHATGNGPISAPYHVREQKPACRHPKIQEASCFESKCKTLSLSSIKVRRGWSQSARSPDPSADFLCTENADEATVHRNRRTRFLGTGPCATEQPYRTGRTTASLPGPGHMPEQTKSGPITTSTQYELLFQNRQVFNNSFWILQQPCQQEATGL